MVRYDKLISIHRLRRLIPSSKLGSSDIQYPVVASDIDLKQNSTP